MHEFRELCCSASGDGRHRYHLTEIGSSGPNLYIAEEISGNQFEIAGGTAGMKVSWQITGIKQDAFANANRIPTEEMKKDKKLGKYVHPGAYNIPNTAGIAYDEKRNKKEIE